jgi:parB-like protein
MKANATVSVRRNAVQNKKARTTGKVCTKKNTGSPLPQASADLPEQQIALDSIVPNDFNPRRNFSEQSLRELADNMTRVGLIHAVTLRSRSDGQEGYSLVCGERRFRAARLAGWETIRAKICPMSDAEAEDFAIAENLQREDITPFEQGQAFKRLIDTRRYDVGTLALHFGRTRDFVLSRIRLLDLIPEVIELLNSEEINISQALELCRYEKEIQREVYDGYFKMGLDCHWRHLRAKELRSRLAGMYLSQLNSYRFDKTECASCASNKANQVLFADCGDCNVCQNRACMKRKNTEYLVAEAKRLLSECPGIRIGYFEDCSQGEVLQALRNESCLVRALGYAGYYEAHPEKPEEPCREDFIEEVDYTESMNTFRSALDEYEQECADIQRRVEAGELIRYAVIGDRSIEFCYDEPIPVKEEQNESYSVQQTCPDNSAIFSENTFTTVPDIVSFAGESIDPETGEILSSQEEEMSAETIDRAKTQEEIEREEKINVLKERHDNNYQLYLDHMAADMKIALRKTDYREGALTEEEQRIFWFLLLRTLDRRLCPQFGLDEQDWPMSEEQQVRICRKLTTEQQVLLLREFIRDKLMEHCSVPGLISRLSGDFVDIHQPDAYREIRSRHKDVYDRRLSGIFQRLKTLGCKDTELPVNETELETRHTLASGTLQLHGTPEDVPFDPNELPQEPPCEIPQTEEPEVEDVPGDDICPEPAITVKEPYLPKPDDSSEETSPDIEEYPELEELDQRTEDNSASEIQVA